MQVQSDSKPYDDINITPMLDLAYVLLIIFIVMTTATVQGMKVNLPKASAAPSLAQQTPRRSPSPTMARSSRHHPGDAHRTSSSALVQQKALTPEFPGGAARRRPGPVPERDGRARFARPPQHTQVGLATKPLVK